MKSISAVRATSPFHAQAKRLGRGALSSHAVLSRFCGGLGAAGHQKVLGRWYQRPCLSPRDLIPCTTSKSIHTLVYSIGTIPSLFLLHSASVFSIRSFLRPHNPPSWNLHPHPASAEQSAPKAPHTARAKTRHARFSPTATFREYHYEC